MLAKVERNLAESDLSVIHCLDRATDLKIGDVVTTRRDGHDKHQVVFVSDRGKRIKTEPSLFPWGGSSGLTIHRVPTIKSN